MFRKDKEYLKRKREIWDSIYPLATSIANRKDEEKMNTINTRKAIKAIFDAYELGRLASMSEGTTADDIHKIIDEALSDDE